MGLGRKSLCLLCFLCLNSVAFGLIWPVSKSGQISSGNLVNATLQAYLHDAKATITIQHTQAVGVCLQRIVQLPDVNRWNESCTIYFEMQGNNKTANFVITNDIYSWGVKILNTSAAENITVSIDGPSCPDAETPLYNETGTNCVAAEPLESGKPEKFTLLPQSRTFYTFTAGSGITSVSLALSGVDSAYVQTYVRRNGVPTETVYDASGKDTLQFTYPQPGIWYVTVLVFDTEFDDALDVTFSLTVNACPAGSYGKNCNATVVATDPSNLATTPLTLDTFVYFQVTTTKDTPLDISFQSANTKIPIVVFGAIGNIPSAESYLVKGCNQPNCNSVTTIKFDSINNTSLLGNETWIFALTSYENDTTVGAWINSVCAPTCDSPSGECQTDGADTGLCLCEDSYVGIDCQTAIGLPSQYIVLIIIAGLVLASAIIGFIAWAYMRRRRRVHYEKVV